MISSCLLFIESEVRRVLEMEKQEKESLQPPNSVSGNTFDKTLLDRLYAYSEDTKPVFSEEEEDSEEQMCRSKSVHDSLGKLIPTGADLCDCLVTDCRGCFYPCRRCQSTKCGNTCRVNRAFTYELVRGSETAKSSLETRVDEFLAG